MLFHVCWLSVQNLTVRVKTFNLKNQSNRLNLLKRLSLSVSSKLLNSQNNSWKCRYAQSTAEQESQMWSCCCNIFPISCIGTSSLVFLFGLTFASQQLWVHLETFSQFSSWKGVCSHTLKQKQDPRDRLCSTLPDSNLICTVDALKVSQIAQIFWNREILSTNKEWVINFQAAWVSDTSCSVPLCSLTRLLYCAQCSAFILILWCRENKWMGKWKWVYALFLQSLN